MQTASSLANSKLSQKYQTVVPQAIRKVLGIKKGDELIWTLKTVGQRTVAEIYPKPKSWTEYMHGLGKKVWKDVNIDLYVKGLRDEWKKKY